MALTNIKKCVNLNQMVPPSSLDKDYRGESKRKVNLNFARIVISLIINILAYMFFASFLLSVIKISLILPKPFFRRAYTQLADKL